MDLVIMQMFISFLIFSFKKCTHILCRNKPDGVFCVLYVSPKVQENYLNLKKNWVLNFHSDNAEYSNSRVFVKSLYSHIFSKGFLSFLLTLLLLFPLSLSSPLSSLSLFLQFSLNTVGKSHLSSILALV